MSKVDAGDKGSKQAGQDTGDQGQGKAAPAGKDLDTLANALRFEREKNEVLLNEVVSLEDELVNRLLGDFEGVIGEATRDFWREQLLSNREAATAALNELRLAKSGTGPVKAGPEEQARPLHNRERARALVRQGYVGQAAGGDSEMGNTAVRIRNRAHELSKLERIPFSAAFRRAEKELTGD